MEEPSSEREVYEAISAEYGISAGVLVRRDGTRETVSLQAIRMPGSGRGVQLVVHAAEENNSFLIVADREHLLEHLREPLDPTGQG